jgi:hypothetical protein
MFRSFLLAALLISSSLAFAPSPRRCDAVRSGLSVNTLYLKSSPSNDNDNNNDNGNDDNNDDSIVDMLPLALKFAGVLGIKTVRDVATYPTLYASNAVQSMTTTATTTSTTSTSTTTETNASTGGMNMSVLFVKFMAIMTFKTIHDLLYYSALYTLRIVRSDDDDEMMLMMKMKKKQD